MTATNMPAQAFTRDQFLDAARVAGLLSDDQHACAASNLSPDLLGDDAASALVAAGFLTQFQADRLLSGKTDGFVLGQYQILDQIGVGAASRVYRARHKTMNRLVAVKVFGQQQTRKPACRDAFRDNARAAARLTHPNVVTVLDVNQIGDRVFLVLEYLEGTSVGVVVRSRGKLPVAQACEYIRQAALGLQHAHEQRMTHGQLDPDAVLVGHPGGVRGERPVVKVAGFEWGRDADRVVGPDDADPDDCRAPELDRPGATPTVESDLYSLGCIFYYLLTGTPARRTATVPLEVLRPDLPPVLAGLVRGLMAEAPAERPVSADEVAERLTPFAETSELASRFDFQLPPGADPAATTGGYLSGLNPIPRLARSQELELEDASPFVGLENGTVDEAAEVTSDTARPHKSLPGLTISRGVLLALASVATLTLFGGAAVVAILTGK